MENLAAPQHDGQADLVLKPLAQLPSAGVSTPHRRIRKTSRRDRCGAEGHLYLQLPLVPRRCLRYLRYQFQSSLAVDHSLHVGRALYGELTGSVPIVDSLISQAGFRIMLGQNFRFGLGGPREPIFKHLRNSLMILLPTDLEQRLIGCVPDKRVLEVIDGIRQQPSAEDQF